MMIYIYPIPVLLLAALVYIVSKQWSLKIFALVAKIIVIVSIVFFVITYASYLGYDIPVVSNLLNNLVK